MKWTSRKSMTPACALAALGCALLAGSSPGRAADVTYERLLNPEPQNWLTHHRDYSAQRHSPLDVINKSNVKNLKLLFAVSLGGKSAGESLEATPLVDDGFMYTVDSWGVVYKIDVRSGTAGKIVWKMDPKLEKQDRNRGVALWNNLVISVTGYDTRVIATDKDTGQIVWDKNLLDQADLELTAAPLALGRTYGRMSLILGTAELGVLGVGLVLLTTSFAAWGAWERCLLALALAFYALGALSGILMTRSPQWNLLRHVPAVPGALGGLVQKNLREMLSVLDVEVLRLLRVAIGPMTLGSLAKGAYRTLSTAEKKALDSAIEGKAFLAS